MPRIHPHICTAILAVFAIYLFAAQPVFAQEIIFADSLEQAAEITNFTASLDSIEQGQSTTISWTTVGATSCTTSGGAGSWSETNIDLPDGSAQIEIDGTGDFIFTLACLGVIGGLDFANIVVSATPVPAVITSFSVSPNAIAEGDNTTVSWTTDFATSCTATNGAGDWSGQTINLPDDSVQITIPAEGAYTFTLTCAGAVGSPVVAEDSVTVTPAAAITSFSASPDSVAENESTLLSWTTENASSCTATNGAGGWAGSTIGLNGESLISIPAVGEYTFTLTCDGVAGTPAVAEEVVTVSTAASITSFTASPDELFVGESTTLSWNVENANTCTASGGQDGWDAISITIPSGEITLEMTTEATTTFTLSCDGDAGPTSVTDEIVTVNQDPNSCRTPALAGNDIPWEDFWQVFFPGPVSDSKYRTVPIGGYSSIVFETANIIDDGKFTTIETTITDGVRLGAISECPGEFDVADECKYQWGIGGGIRWATNGRADACQLDPNTKYYFNLTFTDGVTPSTTTCDKQPCITNVQVSNR